LIRSWVHDRKPRGSFSSAALAVALLGVLAARAAGLLVGAASLATLAAALGRRSKAFGFVADVLELVTTTGSERLRALADGAANGGEVDLALVGPRAALLGEAPLLGALGLLAASTERCNMIRLFGPAHSCFEVARAAGPVQRGPPTRCSVPECPSYPPEAMEPVIVLGLSGVACGLA
jgi:hypothetical protein